MKASVLIEYSVKSLDKTFDYMVPFHLEKNIKVGHKVKVPFGNADKEIEGFVLKLSNELSDDLKYIIDIVDEYFVLNDELLNLGKFLSLNTLSTLISCYQVMLPSSLKASYKTNVSKKYISYVTLNKTKEIEDYILNNKRRKKEIEILNILKENDRVLKSSVASPSLKSLIEKEFVTEIKEEVRREVFYNKEEYENIILTEEQKSAVDNIINGDKTKPFLLYGVTGSGKTEVYIKVIKNVLNQGKTAILLVPEISLTPQIVSRFKSVFESDVAVLHSRLSEGEKFDEYRNILKGNIKIVVGARSAIFAPLKDLGVIIIDEAHSDSYKQDNNPKYNTLDIALERMKNNNLYLILGSATPTLESYARSEKGVYNLITLKSRVNNKDMPKVSLVDMSVEFKKRNYMMSSVLEEKIKEKLSKKEQVIILLNRRGHSTFLTCTSCGYVYKCPYCDISLTYHKTSNNFRCHYCGYSTYKKEECPECNEKTIKNLGFGTEKLEEHLKLKFPLSRIVRMDVDTTSKKGSHEKIIDDFKNQKYDILLGTQMISKGLNFPKVTLVGVVSADASLYIPDFRSSERTFSLLTQTSGRSGRNDLAGEVLIETQNVDNYVLNYIKNYDYLGFYKEEMEIRKKLKYPPYFYITMIKVISEVYEEARDESVKVKKYLESHLSSSFIVLGPTTASMLKLKNKYHFQILIKYKKEDNLLSVLKEINEMYINNKVTIDFNINC